MKSLMITTKARPWVRSILFNILSCLACGLLGAGITPGSNPERTVVKLDDQIVVVSEISWLDGKTLLSGIKERNGERDLRAFKSPDEKFFATLDTLSAWEDVGEGECTVTLFDAAGRVLWRKKLTAMDIEECRISRAGLFVHLSGVGSAAGNIGSFVLSLDARGDEISRLPVHPSPLPLYLMNDDNTVLYYGCFDDLETAHMKWTLGFVDFAGRRRWQHTFGGYPDKNVTAGILAVSGNGECVVFGFDDTVYCWTAEKKELWKKGGDRFPSGVSLSFDGQRLLRTVSFRTLVCDDNMTGAELWVRKTQENIFLFTFIERSHIAAWVDIISPQKILRCTCLDENGKDLERLKFVNSKGGHYTLTVKRQQPNSISICIGGISMKIQEVSWL